MLESIFIAIVLFILAVKRYRYELENEKRIRRNREIMLEHARNGRL